MKNIGNRTENRVPQCKVIYYNWDDENIETSKKSENDLSSSTSIDLSSQIMSCSYSKSMGGPSGTFSFTLSNSPQFGQGDWKRLIKTGSWCLIYMTNEGDLLMNSSVGLELPGAQKIEEAKRLRCIGYIDRVAIKSEMGENGAFDTHCEVSGRDFGVIYEDTDVWHNMFLYEQTQVQDVRSGDLNILSETPLSKVIDIIHDLIFYPLKVKGANPGSDRSLVDIGLQWLMPKQLLEDVNIPITSLKGQPSYWGAIPDIKQISPTRATMAINNATDFLSGNAWNNLQKLSVPAFHELFTETSGDGKPHLYFRPIPFAINKSKYSYIGKNITLYKDLTPRVSVPAIDVVDFDIGVDNHSRYNSFLVTVSTSLINTNDNISLLNNSGFPKHNRNSVKRHGFKPNHTVVDSIVKNAESTGGNANVTRLIEFNHLMQDYWSTAFAAESGSVSKVGTNDVKIGKTLKFEDDVPYVNENLYYIEGYTDTFVVNPDGSMEWNQEVNLTRGFKLAGLESAATKTYDSTFFNRDAKFENQGEFTPTSGGVKARKSGK